MAKTTGQVRAEVILRMKGAIAEGLSAGKFIAKMKATGLSYRRQTMLADWRSVGNIEKKTGLLRYVRKTYQPTPALIAQVTWETSREYMYKIRVETRLRPGEPLEEKFVNIMSDKPLTIAEMERAVQEEWGGWYPEKRDMIESVVAQTAIRRV